MFGKIDVMQFSIFFFSLKALKSALFLFFGEMSLPLCIT